MVHLQRTASEEASPAIQKMRDAHTQYRDMIDARSHLTHEGGLELQKKWAKYEAARDEWLNSVEGKEYQKETWGNSTVMKRA